MLNGENNIIIEDIQNFKNSNGLEFEGLANTILYNIVKEYGNNRNLVIIKDMSDLLDQDKTYLANFGILEENKVDDFLNSSELVDKLLIIPKEYADNYKEFVLNSLHEGYYTHICFEKVFTDAEEYSEYEDFIRKTLGNGVKDIINQSRIRKAKSRKKGIDLEILHRSGLKSLKIINSKNPSNSLITLEDTENTRKAIGLDLSQHIVGFTKALRINLDIIPAFNEMMYTIKREISRTIIMLTKKKVQHKFYILCYYPNVELEIEEDRFNSLSTLVLMQLLYDCNKLGVMPLLSTGQHLYSSHYLSQILYNPGAMFIEDRLDYLLNYPELSFISSREIILRAIGLECRLDLDITYIENQLEWDVDKRYEPTTCKLNISAIDVISIKDDFTGLDDDMFCNIAEKYRDILTVLENSIENTYMLNVLQVIKFRYRKPNDNSDIRNDIDYDKVYIGIVNNIDYKLKTLVEKIGTNGIKTGIRAFKYYDEDNMSKLIPAIIVDGGKAHMKYAKEILKKVGKCLGDKEQPRIDFKMIAPSNALILYNIHTITRELHTPNRVNLLDYCLYNNEAVISRTVLPIELKKYITKKKLRENLTGINCFGMYTGLIGNNLYIELSTLERF